MDVEPIDTTKDWGRKDLLLLATSKENTSVLSQSSVSPNSKIGKVLSYGYMHIHEEASAVKNSDRGWQSWLKSGGDVLILSPTWVKALALTSKTQGLYQIMYLLWGGTETLFSLHYHLTALSVPVFLCFLRSLIEISPRVSIVTRLRSQKWLRPKWRLLYQKRYSWFSFSGDPHLCDYKMILLPYFRRQKSSTPDGSLEASSLLV